MRLKLRRAVEAAREAEGSSGGVGDPSYPCRAHAARPKLTVTEGDSGPTWSPYKDRRLLHRRSSATRLRCPLLTGTLQRRPHGPRSQKSLLKPPRFFQQLRAALPRVTSFRKDDLMNLTISGHHLEVTPALREYVINKLDRVTRHFDQVVDINVLLTVERLKEKERRQKAEVNLHVKGRDIHVEHANEDLYAAIDQLVDKLDRQVCRHKDRVQDHHHATGKRIEAAP
jgi:putative sigma-54 modulation protein